MAKMAKMEYESDAAKDKMGKTGLKDPGHLQVAADYATECRDGTKPYIRPPMGPVKEPNLTNGVPMLPQKNINSGNK